MARVPRQLALTLATIAEAAGGRLTGADREVSGFSIDTRTLKPGDLFFAIRGDRFEGPPVVAGGGAVVSATRAIVPPAREVRLIVVGEPIAALQALAGYVRRESGSSVVAV